MTTAHEIAIAVVISLAALSASTSILLGDSAATAPHALGTCTGDAVQMAGCGRPAPASAEA